MQIKQFTEPLMTRFFVTLALSAFGVGAGMYGLFIMLSPTIVAIFAQQPIPEWTAKDIASLGGFGCFSAFMSWLHIRTCDRHDIQMARKDKMITTMLCKGYDLPPSD